MNTIGEKAVKLGCMQVLPGEEFRVVEALKKACEEDGGTKSIIFKGLGFYDIFIFYESPDFKPRLSSAGSIPGIVNSNTYLCFPYLGNNSNDVFNKLKNTTFVGLSLIKFNLSSAQKSHEIETLLATYLNNKISGHWNVLGTLGWNEVILLISFEEIQDIIDTLLDLNYRFGSQDDNLDIVLKTFSYVGINHDRLPVLEKESSGLIEIRDLLKNNISLNSLIPDSLTLNVNISSRPLYYNEIKKYWANLGFLPYDSLGNFDIVVRRKADQKHTSWSDFLSLLLHFRSRFQSKINSTYTTINTLDSQIQILSDKAETIHNVDNISDTPSKKEYKGIEIEYNKFQNIFQNNTSSIVNHFYTLNSAIQNPICGDSFIDMKEYSNFLITYSESLLKDKISSRTMEKLYLGVADVIRRGTSLRSYGIAGNQERIHGHFSEIRGGAQRALMAIEFIPDHVFNRLKSKWYGFINIDDPKFAHFNQVIICPTESLWEPEQWWALFHEIGHIMLERVPWTKREHPVISSFLLNIPYPSIWHHFIMELYAEVLGYILGFFSNYNLYLEVLWKHLISIEPSQKEFTPLWPYILRTFFVKLYELCFINQKITEDLFQNDVWLYNGLVEHINDIQKIIGDAKNWSENEKRFFSANHCQTLKELFPIARHLNEMLVSFETKNSVKFAPYNLTEDKAIGKAFESIMNGKVFLEPVTSPESLLYKIVLNSDNMDFKKRIATLLTFWNMSQELLKGN